MTRDMNLIRDLLLQIEAENLKLPDLGIPNRSADEIGYHLKLLLEAGLIHGTDITAMENKFPRVLPSRLTWSGHDFLDAARSEDGWKALRFATEKVTSVAFEVAKAFLIDWGKQQLGLK